MKKEGAANRGVLALVLVVLIAAIVTVVMLQRGGDVAPEPLPEPPPAPKTTAITPVAEPPALPPPPPEPVAVVEEPPAEEPVPEPPVEVAQADEAKEPLNARTLAGSKWQPTGMEKLGRMDIKLEIEFAPDGTWRVNDNIRAKWKVEGNRVKIYNDEGEVHYVDIVGDKLMFNGEEVQRAN